ncbi:hypothetical protein BGX26_012122 [Mortierella sp. AD094]|nr:hypothetical protein BGX26_012122 [Mortierella sp. AD094]
MTNPTSRAISRLGIGSYRLTLGIPEHERALYKALQRQKDPRHNITLIDTSSNYANGKSERLIGKVLSRPRHDTLRRDELVIATKFGYIQHENMRLLSEGAFQKVPPDDIVEYSRECYHCIHPEFMRDQLTRSLERLNTRYLDILFVHNPEYYLMNNVKDTEVSVKEHQDILLSRISILFEELEREIERGRILAYGISSNSFSLKPSHAHFLPYQDLITMASHAFEKVQGSAKKEKRLDQKSSQSSVKLAAADNVAPMTSSPTNIDSSAPNNPNQRKSHGLGFLQMPGNLLEMEGVQTTANWAKRQGLRVFLNRPLNAISSDHRPVRLASYPQPQSPTYAKAKDQILEIISAIGQRREYLQPKMLRLREMIESLDASLRVGTISIMHLEEPSIINLLHQELASPVRVKSSPQLHPHTSPSSGQQQSLDRENISGDGSQNSSPHRHGRYSHHSHAISQSRNDKNDAITTTQYTSVKPSVVEVDQLVRCLDRFVQVFHQQVRFQESSRVEKMLTDKGIDLKGESIEKFAVEYLLEHDQVDSVLLGMKREAYVDFAHDMLKTMAETE